MLKMFILDNFCQILQLPQKKNFYFCHLGHIILLHFLEKYADLKHFITPLLSFLCLFTSR